MKYLFLFLVFFSSAILSAQQSISKAHIRLGKEMCKKLDALDKVEPSEWYVETIDLEMGSLLEFVSDEAKQAFTRESGEDLDDYYSVANRQQLKFFTTFLENCPAGRERLLIQQIYGAEADTLLEMKEWQAVVIYATTQLADAAVANNTEQISTEIIRQLNKSDVSEDWAVLESIISNDDLEPLLFTAVSITKPTALTRYKLDEFDSNRLSYWASDGSNSERDWIKDLALEDEASSLCEKVAEFDLENPQTDFSTEEFTPDATSFQRIKAIYPEDIPDYHYRALMGGLVMQDAMSSCEPFKSNMMMQMRKGALAALDLKPEEEETFSKLTTGICACVAMPDRETGETCFEELMGTFGLTKENTSMFDASDEHKRLMEMVMAIGQMKEAFCTGEGE